MGFVQWNQPQAVWSRQNYWGRSTNLGENDVSTFQRVFGWVHWQDLLGLPRANALEICSCLNRHYKFPHCSSNQAKHQSGTPPFRQPNLPPFGASKPLRQLMLKSPQRSTGQPTALSSRSPLMVINSSGGRRRRYFRKPPKTHLQGHLPNCFLFFFCGCSDALSEIRGRPQLKLSTLNESICKWHVSIL